MLKNEMVKILPVNEALAESVMTTVCCALVWNHAKIKMIRMKNGIIFRMGRCSDLNK
jgi:hypothetical protein